MLCRRALNGISEFFGVVDRDPAENDAWKNRKLKLAHSRGKLDSGKGEDYLNKVNLNDVLIYSIWFLIFRVMTQRTVFSFNLVLRTMMAIKRQELMLDI